MRTVLAVYAVRTVRALCTNTHLVCGNPSYIPSRMCVTIFTTRFFTAGSHANQISYVCDEFSHLSNEVFDG